MGIVHQLPRLFREAGFDVSITGCGIDFSRGTPAGEGWYEAFGLLFTRIKPFFLAVKVVTDEEFEQLRQQMLLDMLGEGFTGLLPVFTCWGTKQDTGCTGSSAHQEEGNNGNKSNGAQR